MPLRIGVIGAGHLGRIHARLASGRDEMTLVGVADPVAANAARVAEECRCRAVGDFRELLPDLDAAIVAAPTCLHFGIGQELLRRGVHVLMEKPLAINTVEADHLVALARRQKLVLQVGHIERFSPAFTAVRAAAARPRFIQAARYSGYTFRSNDIGVVHDLMIHDLDLAMQLAGSPVQSVEALGMTVLGGHEDIAQARLIFDNGCVAALQASRVSDQARRTMEVWTDTNRIRLDFADRSALIARTDARVVRGELRPNELSRGEQERLKETVFSELIQLESIEPVPCNPLVLEQGDFLDAIREGRDPQVTGEHGRDVVAVAERILARIAAGNMPQTLPGDAGPHILSGPHWQHAPQSQNDIRRSA